MEPSPREMAQSLGRVSTFRFAGLVRLELTGGNMLDERMDLRHVQVRQRCRSLVIAAGPVFDMPEASAVADDSGRDQVR